MLISITVFYNLLHGNQPATPRQGSWVTYNSPLWKKDRIKSDVQLNASFIARSKCFPAYEASFLNDAIRTSVSSTRRAPVIPTYNALMDKYSQAYFRSPLVQSILGRDMSSGIKTNTRTINKLSARRRCAPTPDQCKLWQMEKGFINDAIITEKRRTRYKDIIPSYDASRDQCCQMYFEREDIKRLLARTCAPRVRFHVKSKSTVS
ncbi:unnamed protein product [Candidula unifasciata]|uniref:Uncharacterized protein n=1 Tax=Candidula unifasciata TaxID=100452 RepID=A0A8S4A688_9EUPU|nr:unnamed protein product [Candidula unifasciata]